MKLLDNLVLSGKVLLLLVLISLLLLLEVRLWLRLVLLVLVKVMVLLVLLMDVDRVEHLMMGLVLKVVIVCVVWLLIHVARFS